MPIIAAGPTTDFKLSFIKPEDDLELEVEGGKFTFLFWGVDNYLERVLL